MSRVFNTADFLKAAVAVLLAFVDHRGDGLRAMCDSRVYIGRAPDNADMPYYIVSEYDGETDPEVANNRREILLEGVGVSSDPQQAELIADLGEAALLSWRSSSEDGLIYGMQTEHRKKEDPADDPENRDRYKSRHVVRVCAWISPLTTELVTTT